MDAPVWANLVLAIILFATTLCFVGVMAVIFADVVYNYLLHRGDNSEQKDTEGDFSDTRPSELVQKLQTRSKNDNSFPGSHDRTSHDEG